MESLQGKRRYARMEDENWLIASNNRYSQSSLVAVDCGQPQVVHYLKPPRENLEVVACIKEQGLVCLLAFNKQEHVGLPIAFVGNPVTNVWEEVNPPAEDSKVLKLIGVVAGAAQYGSYKLCYIYREEEETEFHSEENHVFHSVTYSSRSKAWVEGASLEVPGSETWSCSCTSDGQQAYAWHSDYYKGFYIASYDLVNDKWETIANSVPFHGNIDQWCNQMENFPTLLVCNGVPHYIGRDESHYFLRVYEFDREGQQFHLIGQLKTECSNCAIKYATDGNNIYAVRGSTLIKFSLSSRRWRMLKLTDAIVWTRGRYGAQGMVIATLNGDELAKPVDIPKAPVLNESADLVVVSSANKVFDVKAINVENDEVFHLIGPSWMTDLEEPWHGLPKGWVAAALPELGLFCVLFEKECRRSRFPTRLCFPDRISVGNPLIPSSWTEIPMFELQNREKVTSEKHKDEWDRELYVHEFIGVAMSSHPMAANEYILSSYYRRNTAIIVWLYDSSTKVWNQGAKHWVDGAYRDEERPLDLPSPAFPLPPLPARNSRKIFPYGWRCDVSNSSGKVYLCSGERDYSVQCNLLRVLLYDVVENKWEVIACKTFDDRLKTRGRKRGRGMVLVECCGELFVVGKSNCNLLVEIRKLDGLNLVARFEAEGTISATSCGTSGKIFVSISEGGDQKGDTFFKSKLVVYNIHSDQWNELPIPFPPEGVYHMVMGALKKD